MVSARRAVARRRSVFEEPKVNRERAPDRLASIAEMPVRGAYLPHVLSRLMNLLNLQLLQNLRTKNLTIGQFRVLQFIQQFDGATINEISLDCVIEQSVVSRIVGQLEQRLLVTRKKNRSNARYVQAFLTAKGRTTINEMDHLAKKIAANAASDLTEVEHAQLIALLQKVFHRANGMAKVALD
jgi:DNA-binding MarR family transcriptional regulator